MYPADRASPKGKLRLLYECNPMAYLVEKVIDVWEIQIIASVETHIHFFIRKILINNNLSLIRLAAWLWTAAVAFWRFNPRFVLISSRIKHMF